MAADNRARFLEVDSIGLPAVRTALAASGNFCATAPSAAALLDGMMGPRPPTFVVHHTPASGSRIEFTQPSTRLKLEDFK